MIRRYFPLALALLLALTACSPEPEKVALAKRIDDLQGSFGKQLEAGLLSFAARPPFATAPELYRASVRRTVEAHKDEIAKTENDLAEIFARNNSAEDLHAYLAYLESPPGKSLLAKIAAARAESLRTGNPRRAPELTPEEETVRSAVRLSRDPEKAKAALAEVTERMTTTTNKIRGEAVLGFCNRGGECSPELIARMKSQAGQ